MARLLGGFVEVRLGTGKDAVRKALEKAVKEIIAMDGKKTIAGHLVGGTITDPLYGQIEDPCIVPDFGHNVNCKCEKKEQNGVLRMFGLHFAIDGYPETDEIFGTYELSDDVHLIVSMTSAAEKVENPKAVPKMKRWDE